MRSYYKAYRAHQGGFTLLSTVPSGSFNEEVAVLMAKKQTFMTAHAAINSFFLNCTNVIGWNANLTDNPIVTVVGLDAHGDPSPHPFEFSGSGSQIANMIFDQGIMNIVLWRNRPRN